MSVAPLPTQGSIVALRRRHWLVHGVKPGDRPGDATLVGAHCIDDDAAGMPVEVLWELESGARVIDETRPSVGGGLDAPRAFGAYLNALRWNAVSSTDATLLQSPFRAGIDIKPYQLEPLRKALALPRVNLFIADDVGLGKTIEAGLVMQELLLRQRIDRILVVAPPSVTLQWQEELEQRFGLSFALYDSEFVARRRRERGWGVNPWATHRRFIVSYALLRGRKEGKASTTRHLDLLIASLGDRAARSLLILDEAHQVAPSGDTPYAIDTKTTHAIRQISARFEHRLFLSATPHNGHSNSFSSLLHLLDPQRFTQGVSVAGVQDLEPVMVRRLKRDLRAEVGGLPERKLVDHVLPLAPNAPEIQLGRLLADYEDAYGEALAAMPVRERDARHLVCVNLHKRLLSSIAAFHRTLEVHAKAIAAHTPAPLPPAPSRDDDERDEEARDADEDTWVAAATVTPAARAEAMLAAMRKLSAGNKDVADARVVELARWIRTELCPNGKWNDRRVVVFTEYDETLRWLLRVLPDLIGDCDGRIDRYTGKLSDKNREALKKVFNADPAKNPLRILLATDAAREGINLQAHCADLFHFDLPWNPSRVEQRNGRIDRTLQPAPVVRCHYFDMPDRPEDRVLTYMVKKMHVISEELGSLSDVLSERIAARMERGLRGLATSDIDRLAHVDEGALRAVAVLESRGQGGTSTLRGDLAALDALRAKSQATVGYRPDHLREAVDLGLRLATRTQANPDGHGLEAILPPDDPPAWRLPALDDSFGGLLDRLRADPADGAWKGPIKPVSFTAAHVLDAETVQLHLGHPLVKRLLARFLAQGFGAHDLNRCTVIPSTDRLRRVVAFGRLALFGPRATRLHEVVIEVAAQVRPDGTLQLFKEAGAETTVAALAETLAAGPALHPSRAVQDDVRRRASADFATLWAEIRSRAEAAEGEARTALVERGEVEATELRAILDRQERRIRVELGEEADQMRLAFRDRRQELDQYERDLIAMTKRLEAIKIEREQEPLALRAAYEVALRRVEPIGLVYLWPQE